MRVLMIMVCLTMYISAQSILVMSSNANIKKYQSMDKGFQSSTKQPFKYIDISRMSQEKIEEYLYDTYPDVIYAIGTKAYQYAARFVPEKKIFFSGIVNYKRMHMGKNRYGVSAELHTGIQLTLTKSFFPNLKRLGMVYSNYTKDVYQSFKTEAKLLGIEVAGQKIDKGDSLDIERFKRYDAFMMIADPLLVKKDKEIKKLFREIKQAKKPVIAYHELYLKYGAALILSLDMRTIGRQISGMIEAQMIQDDFVPIQHPVGTKVIFNKKESDRSGLNYKRSAMGIANKVIR